MAEEVKKEEVKKKGPLGKIKELAEDKEEQMEIFQLLSDLGILDLVWRVFNLNYVAIPNFHKRI